jgi:hypothetical protein
VMTTVAMTIIGKTVYTVAFETKEGAHTFYEKLVSRLECER